MQRGGWIDPRSASTPFADVALEWLDSNPSKRPSTLARDDVTLRLHLLPPLGKRPIGQVTPAEVQALVKRWVGERKPSSVARDYRTLAAILNYAVEQEFIARAPCRKVKLPKGSQRHVHVVDADELARMAKAMGEYGPMAYLAAVLGLRWGEVAGLRVGRLDLDDRVLERETGGPRASALAGRNRDAPCGLSPHRPTSYASKRRATSSCCPRNPR